MFIITKSKQLAHVALPVHFTLDTVCKTIAVIALILENLSKKKTCCVAKHKTLSFFLPDAYTKFTHVLLK